MKRGLNNQIGDDPKRQSTSRLRRLLSPARSGHHLVLWSALAAASLLMIEACSLGEATVPECNGPEECHPSPTCDDGNGFIKPTVECCLELAARHYGLCCIGTEGEHDCSPSLSLQGGSLDCGGAAIGSCCDLAGEQFTSCMAGHSSSGTGGGGTGGAGGAATGGSGG